MRRRESRASIAQWAVFQPRSPLPFSPGALPRRRTHAGLVGWLAFALLVALWLVGGVR